MVFTTLPLSSHTTPLSRPVEKPSWIEIESEMSSRKGVGGV